MPKGTILMGSQGLTFSKGPSSGQIQYEKLSQILLREFSFEKTHEWTPEKKERGGKTGSCL